MHKVDGQLCMKVEFSKVNWPGIHMPHCIIQCYLPPTRKR